MNVDDKVSRYYLVFIFADVLWAQLHLASFYVVTSLDERCIEHYSAHCFVAKACMSKHDLDITLEHQALLLLLCKEKNDAIFFLAVELLRWVGELLSDVETSTAIDFKERHAATR